MTQSIEDRARFDFIRYASCWEDADILAAALRPAPGRRLLSIASAGDNSLALLAGGAEVVAADLNLVQLACVEIRKVAFAHLDYPDLLAFLGVTPSSERLQTFGKLATALSPASRAFWDARPEAIRTGIIHAGKFENYFRMFRTRILPLIHGRKTVEALLAARDDTARRQFYDKVWDNWRWRLLFRLFFSRTVMGRMGRDPEFFRYVEGSVARRIRDRAEHALAVLPTHSNPYLEYILTGNFRRALPAYLRPEAYAPIRANLDRLTLYHGPIQEAAKACGGGFDGFNLSDIFEYLPQEFCQKVYGSLLETARPGARLAYWNMLVPRQLSATPEFAGRVRHLGELSHSLFLKDNAFFYSAFVVEET